MSDNDFRGPPMGGWGLALAIIFLLRKRRPTAPNGAVPEPARVAPVALFTVDTSQLDRLERQLTRMERRLSRGG